MHDMKTQFGIPDTLPPLGFREARGFLWLGFNSAEVSAFPVLRISRELPFVTISTSFANGPFREVDADAKMPKML